MIVREKARPLFTIVQNVFKATTPRIGDKRSVRCAAVDHDAIHPDSKQDEHRFILKVADLKSVDFGPLAPPSGADVDLEDSRKGSRIGALSFEHCIQ